MAINVHKDDYLAVQEPERDHTPFAIRFPPVLAGNGWQIPDRLGASKVETVVPQIRQAFCLVPGRHC